MVAAIDAVKDSTMGVLPAAKQYSVPQQTLGDRVSGKVIYGTNPGPKPFPNCCRRERVVELCSRRC